MTRGLSPDQRALLALADEVMAGRTSNEQLATVELSPDRSDTALWKELADCGVLGIAVPEAFGGAGLGLTELCLLLELQGRRMALVPLWETTLLGADPLVQAGSQQQREQWLPRVAAGDAVLTAAVDLSTNQGSTRDVPHGHLADTVLLPDGDGVLLADVISAQPVVMTNHQLAADLELVTGERLPGTVSWDRARLGLAALLLGLADEGVRDAAAHLTAREQFGRPLATFQATTQQLGDAYCDVQAMRATLWQAVWALDQQPDASTTERSVETAVWWAVDAAGRVQHVVQHLHGGLGADTSYPVHRRLLWTLRTVAQLGSPSRQLEKLGATL